MYISEWDLHGAATSYYQQLVPKGEIYTQGHGIPPCIYQNGIYGCRYYYQQLVPQGRNIHRDMAFLHVYIRDLHGAATTTSSLCHKGEIYTQGHGIPPCISEWDLHGAALHYYQQLVPQGRNIHPGTCFLHMYISEWDLRCRLATTSLAAREYTQGHGIPPCIYQNGIYTVQR
jgi:hypothetical protein